MRIDSLLDDFICHRAILSLLVHLYCLQIVLAGLRGYNASMKKDVAKNIAKLEKKFRDSSLSVLAMVMVVEESSKNLNKSLEVIQTEMFNMLEIVKEIRELN